LAPPHSRIWRTVQKQSVDRLAGNATLLDQLQQCVFNFDVQELLQFISEVAMGGGADEGFPGS
jgi:hypothetical protein